MAKVKIQGHASGTGILTVTAPNTSTDRTITLPDATSTLATTADVPAGIVSSADATAITINSSEQVGIGVTSPDTTLHIKGTNQIAKFETTSATGQNYIRFTGSSGNKGYFGYGGGSNDLLSLFNQENYDMAFGTNDTERMRILAGGGLTFNGDTAAANALDDYEEGTHTVTATCSGGGSITLSSTNNKFTYTKIGNLVTITGRLDVSAISSPSGDLYFSLPFAIAQIGSTNNTDTSAGMFVWYPVSGDSGKWVSWADAGTSIIYVRHGDGVQPPQSANLVRVSTEFRMNFSYRTA